MGQCDPKSTKQKPIHLSACFLKRFRLVCFFVRLERGNNDLFSVFFSNETFTNLSRKKGKKYGQFEVVINKFSKKIESIIQKIHNKNLVKQHQTSNAIATSSTIHSKRWDGMGWHELPVTSNPFHFYSNQPKTEKLIHNKSQFVRFL